MSSPSPQAMDLLQEYLEETTKRGFLLIDQNGRVQYANEQFYRFFAIDPKVGFQGRPLSDCLRLLEKSKAIRHDNLRLGDLLILFLNGDEHRIRLNLKSGSWVSLTGKPMARGGYALTVTDVTQTRHAFDTMKRINRATVMALAELAESRDHDTGAHVLKVGRLTQDIAWELRNKEPDLFAEIDGRFMEHVALASILHDVGKVVTPDRILLKPGPLNDQERAIMCEHARVGGEIIDKMIDFHTDNTYLKMASRIAQSHHEKYSGEGYPYGLRGDEIPLEGRIVAVSDVFDALISWRPYKKPWPVTKAINLIQECSGSQFDPRVVDAFQRVMKNRSRTQVLGWSDVMTVGDPEMDKDHQILISLINQLSGLRQREDLIIVELVIEELLNYTIRHFSREERLMQEVGFPNFLEHQKEHLELADRVSQLRQQFLLSSESKFAEKLMSLLNRWLSHHILVEDRKYYPYVIFHRESRQESLEERRQSG